MRHCPGHAEGMYAGDPEMLCLRKFPPASGTPVFHCSEPVSLSILGRGNFGPEHHKHLVPDQRSNHRLTRICPRMAF